MMKRPTSLHARLLAWLLAAIFLIAVIQVAVSYRTALQQTDEVFDYQLERTAISLGAGVPLQALATPSLSDSLIQRDWIIQIWSADGLQVFGPAQTVLVPDRAILGFSTVRTSDTRFRMFALQTPYQVIQVAQDMRVREAFAQNLALRGIAPIALLAPLLMLLVWWVVTRSLKPVERARRQVARRQVQDLAPIPTDELPDEIRPLVHELNQLLQRVDQAYQAQQRFIADAAHELRSPLAAMTLQLEGLRRSQTPEEQARHAQRLEDGLQRARTLLEQLLLLARSESPQQSAPAQCDVVQVLRDSCVEALALAQARGIQWTYEGVEQAPAQAEGGALQLVLRNLLDNAVKYTPDHGQVLTRISAQEEGWRVEIEDSGPGVPPSQRAQVFERFYRDPANAALPGSGLGLAIVQAIARQQALTLTLDDSPGLGGLRVTVQVPKRQT